MENVMLIRILKRSKVEVLRHVLWHRRLHEPVLWLVCHLSMSWDWHLICSASHAHCRWWKFGVLLLLYMVLLLQLILLLHHRNVTWHRHLHHWHRHRWRHHLCLRSPLRIVRVDGPILLSLDSVFIWLPDLDLCTLCGER